MSSPDTITLTRTGDQTATVTLSNPDRRNAISERTARDLAAAVDQLVEWGATAVHLDAVGPAFCAGADLADLESSARAVDEVLDLLTAAPVYWLATVRGHVRGAGMAVLAACPRVLATETSTFGLPEVARGFFPTDLMQGQASVVGARRAFDLAFSGQAISAHEAERIGLVSRAVAEDRVDDEARAELEQIAAIDPVALRDGVRAWQTRAREGITGSARGTDPRSHEMHRRAETV